MKIDWVKWAWLIGFLVAFPGVLIYIGYRWWFSLFVFPTLSVPLIELLDKPMLEIVLAVLFFFASPSLFFLAFISFIVGVRLLLD